MNAVMATAIGRQDSHAQSSEKNPLSVILFHGLFGLVSSATVYAPTA
ncbi:branched-chain amino acid transport system permease domain protein [Rhodococcus sp. MTM3W5.2]|nr:branched-chain amino acid transport system permease domain protein [Rhodococcus sp. MTM3W5.2]